MVSAYPPQPSRCCDRWPVAHYCEVRETWKDEDGPCLPHKPPGDYAPGFEIECAIADSERADRVIDSTGMLDAHVPMLPRAASVRPKVTTMGWSESEHEWYEFPDPTRCCVKWPMSHYCSMREAWSCDDVVRLLYEPLGEYWVGSDLGNAVLALQAKISKKQQHKPEVDLGSQYIRVQNPSPILPTTSLRLDPRNTPDTDTSKTLRSFRLVLRQRNRHPTTSRKHAKRPLDSVLLELYLHIRSCLNPEDQLSLGFASQNFYPSGDQPSNYHKMGLMYPPNVRIHGVRIEELARGWSATRKGITWMEPFTKEKHYCCADKVENGYIVYLHTLSHVRSLRGTSPHQLGCTCSL